MIKKGMKQCTRCREIKEAEYFRVGQPYWVEWCKKCEATPSGKISKDGELIMKMQICQQFRL